MIYLLFIFVSEEVDEMREYDFDAYLKQAERCRSKSGNVSPLAAGWIVISSMHLVDASRCKE